MNPTEFAQFTEKRNALIAQVADAHSKGDHTAWTEATTKLDNMDGDLRKHNEQEQRNAYAKKLEQRNALPAPSQSVPDAVVKQTRSGGNDPRATEEYRNQFLDYINGGEVRNLNITNGPDGQFALAPAQYDEKIITPAGTASGVRGELDLIVLNGTTDLKGLTLSARSGGFTKGRKINLASDTQASLTMNKRALSLSPFKAFIKLDNPFLDNNIMKDPLGFVSDQLRILKEENQEGYIFTGSGNEEPLGILTADAQGIPTSKQITQGGTGGAVTLTQLVAMQYNVKPKHRPNAQWRFSKDQCIQIDSLHDSQGRPLVKEYLTSDGPVKTLLGSPIKETQGLTAAFTTATSGVFADTTLTGFYGDLKQYQLIESGIPAIKLSRERLIEEDVALLIMLFYMDGQAVDFEAFSVCKIVN